MNPLRGRLLAWYRRAQRPLPWRKDISPYRTWVSEIMLQQTTVATVIPYYRRFLDRFPSIASLAKAKEQDVLREWAGLGYYSRARNLHKAARSVMKDHGGVFPDAFEDILDLPGIGRYTAGAILSIAFEKPYPVLDGNVMRVFSRLFALKGDIKEGKTAKSLWALAEDLMPQARPGDWNQALMELGATVCLPESPACGACPVAKHCAAFKKDMQDELPVTGQRRAPIDLAWTCLWIEKDGKILLWKRSEGEKFLKNHWGLPEARHLQAEIGEALKTVRHCITHHRITLEIRRAALKGTLPAQARWVPRSKLNDHLVSSLWRKSVGIPG